MVVLKECIAQYCCPPPKNYKWNLSVDCIEKEFSTEKFIMAQLDWGKKVTAEQFKYIMSTLDR